LKQLIDQAGISKMLSGYILCSPLSTKRKQSVVLGLMKV